MYFLSGGTIHVSTNIQEIAAQSTTKAEIIVMRFCAKQAITSADSIEIMDEGLFSVPVFSATAKRLWS